MQACPKRWQSVWNWANKSTYISRCTGALDCLNLLQLLHLRRGKISDDVLETTLRDQRKLEPRPKLGDMLVQRGLVTQAAISEARRFQVEEDICDILSWKSARFHFATGNSAREIYPEDFAAEQ